MSVQKPIVSHSEAESFLVCEQRHWYAFVERLEPKDLGLAIKRGRWGHGAFEVFFKARRDKVPYMNALSLVSEYLGQQLFTTSDPKEIEALQQLAVLVPGFLTYFQSRIEPWTVISVEETFWIEFEEFKYPFTVDFLVRERNGENAIFDAKFTYDFYHPLVIENLPQIPKYAGGLRLLGQRVDKGYYAFVRYRSLKDPFGNNTYAMEPVSLTKPKIDNAFRDQLTTVRRIAKLKAEGTLRDNISRTATQNNCKNCHFLHLCAAESNGSNGELLRKTLYQPNSYGYSEG